MKHTNLVVRADASALIGTGHVMRMLALAQAWQYRGGNVHLVSRELPLSLRERIESHFAQCHQIRASTIGSPADADQTVQLAHQIDADWIIADGYEFGPSFQQTIRHNGTRLAVVTDFDYCDRWHCDLVINQNPHARHESYNTDQTPFRRCLGNQYALLRREFLGVNVYQRRVSGSSIRLLLTLGGSDMDNVTGKILELLEQRETTREQLEIRVLIGAANPNGELLRRQVAASRHQATVLSHVSDMAAQYQWSDGLIGAGGSSCWEWMHAGLHAAITVIADNQQPIYDHLVEHRIAMGIGRSNRWDPAFVRSKLSAFVGSIASQAKDPQRFRHLVDGHGAARIAAVMDTGVWLREANTTDRKMYFDWANDPTVRVQSLVTDSIPWDAHCRWFDNQLGSPDARLFVAMRDEQPVGQIRFNRDDDGNWIVSFSVAEEARGTGLGKELLVLGSARMQTELDATLLATVRTDNEASARCFRRLGWQPVASTRADLLQFRRAA